MPVKPKPKDAGRWRRMASEHPKLTLTGALAIVATVVSILWTVVPATGAWLGRYQTIKDANIKNAWMQVSVARIEATVARNRVNDCNIVERQRPLEPLERAACEQYHEDLDQANTRYRDALKSAKELSK